MSDIDKTSDFLKSQPIVFESGDFKFDACAMSLKLMLNQQPTCTCTIPYTKMLVKDGDFDTSEALEEFVVQVYENRRKGVLMAASMKFGRSEIALDFHGYITAVNVIYASEARSSKLLQVTLGSVATILNTSLLNDTVVVTNDKLIDVPNPTKAAAVCAAIANRKTGTLFNQDDAFESNKICDAVTKKLGLTADATMIKRLDAFMAVAIEVVASGCAALTDNQLATVSSSTIISSMIACDLKLNPAVIQELGGKVDISRNINRHLLSSFIKGLISGKSIWGTLIETLASYDYMLCFAPHINSKDTAGKICLSSRNTDAYTYLSDAYVIDTISSYNVSDSINMPDTFLCSFSKVTAYMTGEENDSKAGDLLGVYTRNATLKNYVDNGGASKLPDGSKYRVRLVRAPNWLALSVAAAINNSTASTKGKPTQNKKPETDAERVKQAEEQNKARQDHIKNIKNLMNKVAESLYNDQYGANDSVELSLILAYDNFYAVMCDSSRGLGSYFEVQFASNSTAGKFMVLLGRLMAVSVSLSNGAQSSASIKITLDKVILGEDSTIEARLKELKNSFTLFVE